MRKRSLRLGLVVVVAGGTIAGAAYEGSAGHTTSAAASGTGSTYFNANVSASEAEAEGLVAPRSRSVDSAAAVTTITNKGTSSLGPGNPTASWSGDNVDASTAGPSDTQCNAAGARCDDYFLNVTTPSRSGSFTVNVTMTPPEDYDLYIYDKDGNAVGNSGNPNGVPETATVPCPSAASSPYKVRVVYFTSINDPAQAVYSATATYNNTGACLAAAIPTQVSTLAFAPSTLDSAHFIAGEPQLTMERQESYTQPNSGIDNNRIYVDWPLSSRSNTGQLSRSLDGGDSFRLLLDPSCASRNRPNCLTGGGGDTEEDVNLANGDLFFADQEVLANEAFASSLDHGDTFPQQTAVSNLTTATDRQWIAATDNTQTATTTPGSTIEAFFSFHVPPTAYIQAVPTLTHLPVDQPAPQLTNAGQTGQPRVDNNASSKGHGWIYYPYRGFSPGGTFVAAAPSATYFNPRSWHPRLVSSNAAQSFPWIAIDRHGNAYLSFDSGGVVYLVVSPIDNPLNDPTGTPAGTPGTYWSVPFRVTPAAVTSAVFPEIYAGDEGRVGLTYVGTTEYAGDPNSAPDNVHWSIYGAVITNATSQTPTIDTGLVSHRIVHRGNICTRGTTCLAPQDRSFLDMIDVSMDAAGRLGVQFEDNFTTGFQDDPAGPGTDLSPFLYFAKQTVGPTLATNGSVNLPQRLNSATDPSGDATWLNHAYTMPGTNLPSLDATGLSLSLVGANLVAHLPLSNATIAQMQTDIAAFNAACGTPLPGCRAQRLLYIVRFNTADKAYFMAFQLLPAGTPSTFGGQLDTTNDEVFNVANPQGVVAAAYRNDGAGYQVSGGPAVGEITLTAPAANFGLVSGAKLFSVTGFATAGPTEGNDGTSADVLRTVDATPPFDTTLGGSTAVLLRSFAAVRTGAGVLLRWRTASDTQVLGFNLYRQRQTKRVKLNRAVIAAAGAPAGRSYSWRDRRAPGGAVAYRLQAVSRAGTRSWIGATVTR